MSFSFVFPLYFSLADSDDDESASLDDYESDDLSDESAAGGQRCDDLEEHLKDVNVAELDADVECAICLNSIIHEEEEILAPVVASSSSSSDSAAAGSVKSMPCFHVYHENCIRRWLAIQTTCPICLSRLPAATPAAVDTFSPMPSSYDLRRYFAFGRGAFDD